MVDKKAVIEKLSKGMSSDKVMGLHKISKKQLAAIRNGHYRTHGKENSLRAYQMIEEGCYSDSDIKNETGLSKRTLSAHKAWYTMQNRAGGKEGKSVDNIKLYEDLLRGVSDEKVMERYDIDRKSLGAYKANLTRLIEK